MSTTDGGLPTRAPRTSWRSSDRAHLAVQLPCRSTPASGFPVVTQSAKRCWRPSCPRAFVGLSALSGVRSSHPQQAFQGTGHTGRKSPAARPACRSAFGSSVYSNSSASRSDTRSLESAVPVGGRLAAITAAEHSSLDTSIGGGLLRQSRPWGAVLEVVMAGCRHRWRPSGRRIRTNPLAPIFDAPVEMAGMQPRHLDLDWWVDYPAICLGDPLRVMVARVHIGLKHTYDSRGKEPGPYHI
jgi:hypothetical protein